MKDWHYSVMAMVGALMTAIGLYLLYAANPAMVIFIIISAAVGFTGAWKMGAVKIKELEELRKRFPG